MNDHKYRGPYTFLPSVKVLVNGASYWVEDDWIYCKDGFYTGIAKWRNDGEKQQVIDALIAAHARAGDLLQIPKCGQAEIELFQKTGNWQVLALVLGIICFFLLVWGIAR